MCEHSEEIDNIRLAKHLMFGDLISDNPYGDKIIDSSNDNMEDLDEKNNNADVERPSRVLKLYVSACAQSKKSWSMTRSPNDCGEDSFFIDNNAIGVADGVGGWNAFGISSKLIAQTLMNNSRNVSKSDPIDIISKAYRKIVDDAEVFAGSTTCTVLKLLSHKQEQNNGYDIKDGSSDMLHVAYIGDSGYIIVRDGKTIYRSPSLYRNISDAPNALAIVPSFLKDIGIISDDPSTAIQEAHPVQSKDIIVVATDGLWDNLPNELDIGTLISHWLDKNDTLDQISEKIVDIALYYYVKPDDITVLVAQCK